MAAELKPVAIYDRTSGDEGDTGQDVEAGAAQARAAAEARGLLTDAALVFDADDGVSSFTDPWTREGFQAAVAAVREGRARGLVVREVSRFTRARVPVAFDYWRRLQAEGVPFLSLAEAHFDTLTRPEDPEQGPDDSMTDLLRAVTFAFNHKEKHKVGERTQARMDAIKEGRVATKSGKPPGRPRVTVTDEEVEWARAELAKPGASLLKVHAALLDRRGYNAVTDPKAKKKRFVSRDTLARALGLRGDPAQNDTLRKTSEAPRDGDLSRNGSVVRNGEEGSS